MTESQNSTKRVAKGFLSAVLAPLLMTACTVGPEYKKPEVTPPSSFRAQAAEAGAQSIGDMPWKNVFSDKALQTLIAESLTNNNDLRVAVARIQQARAMVDVARSEGIPQFGYQGTAEGGRGASPENETVRPTTFGNFNGLLTAAWELDIWGRIRRTNEAAQANLLGQMDIRRGVMLTLVGDIAANYFRLIELDQELAIARESAQVYKSTLNLFTLRFEAGRDSKLPVERAQSAYDASTAAVHDLTRQISQLENAISTLVGAYPKEIPRGTPLDDQAIPETPLGSTTALLQRRPDILEAEQRMIAANAEIGVAAANFFPKIGLSAFVGGQGISVAGTTTGFGVWGAALDLAGPIFSGGRLEGIYQQRQAFWDETVAQYKQKILVAFRETSDALVARQTLVSREAALQSQVRALQHSADLALDRYRSGRASYFEILEAQQQLFPAKSTLAQTRRDQLVAVVNLYKALGGGWTPDEQPQQTAALMPVSDPSGGEKP
ncbi:MAG TPA: efflux transporter outer membrane subunit [Rhizomicrobium sp.]|nr:efflux transporter outer membrane subunit [Rhizomicrobium sp.]